MYLSVVETLKYIQNQVSHHLMIPISEYLMLEMSVYVHTSFCQTF